MKNLQLARLAQSNGSPENSVVFLTLNYLKTSIPLYLAALRPQAASGSTTSVETYSADLSPRSPREILSRLDRREGAALLTARHQGPPVTHQG